MQPQDPMEYINKILFNRVQQLRGMCEKLQGELDVRAKVEVELSPAKEAHKTSQSWGTAAGGGGGANGATGGTSTPV